MDLANTGALDLDFTDRVASNQTSLVNNLKKSYDFIVCGAGTSGSVVARPLAESPLVNFLLIEAAATTCRRSPKL